MPRYLGRCALRYADCRAGVQHMSVDSPPTPCDCWADADVTYLATMVGGEKIREHHSDDVSRQKFLGDHKCLV